MSAFGGLSQVPLKNSGIAPKVRIANDCNATLIDNKQLRPHLRERTVRLRTVRHLITHAGRERECPAIFHSVPSTPSVHRRI